MLKYWLLSAALLTMLGALPIFAIRAQPYEDRATQALVQPDCPAPCFMGIRPGVTTMREALYKLPAHAWVANGPNEFPAQVRNAVFFDAVLPRTLVNWRWSTDLPTWINPAERGSMTVEDWNVLDVMVDTRLQMGDILLAFGPPDAAHFITAGSRSGRWPFEYAAWYARQGMLVTVQGLCTAQRDFFLPVRVFFQSAPPKFAEPESGTPACQ